ncbi:MAG: NADH-quinone oxidoreductase subunit M, partial [Anaerolineales bacterium]
MDFITDNLLTLILLLPTAGAILIVILPGKETKLLRWTAFLVSLVPLGLSIYMWVEYQQLSPEGYQFVVNMPWYEAINSQFHLGVDGISVPMVLLTTLLTPLALLASFSVEKNVKAYMALFLLLETGMLGVFMSLDLLLFFLFWEIGLVPMYFLINQWGSANRDYASIKFMIYTMAGSLGLLLAIQLLGVVSGTFSLPDIVAGWTELSGTYTFTSLAGNPIEIDVSLIKTIAFWAFVVAFAIKVPVWPFHTWLPDAHTEAPTAGSMILAGVLLKLGAYGFLRLILPLYPEQATQYAIVLGILATAAIVFGAFASWAQDDFKRLVAYSSVNHMGFVVLGIAAAAY